MTDKKDKVILSDTDQLKGVCLTLWSDDQDQIEKFKGLCYSNLPKQLNWFHQCNSRQYQMFEFWTPRSNPIKAIGGRIAKELGLEFVVDLTQDYVGSSPVEVPAFREFYPDFHTYDNFND